MVSVVVVVWEGGFGAFCTNFGGQSANMSLGIASGPGVIVRCFAEPYVAMYRARAVSCLSLVVRARAFFFLSFCFLFSLLSLERSFANLVRFVPGLLKSSA